MVPLRRFTPLLAFSLLLFLTTCQDETAPDGPVGVDLSPAMSHVTNDNPALGNEDNGLFFFRPPIDDDEAPQGFLDTDVQPILFLELCNVEGLGGFDPFVSACPVGRLVARLDDTNRVFGQTLTVQAGGAFDFYQAVLKLNQLGPAVGELHAIRVIIGSPETEGAFVVPGHLPAIFTDNASEQDPEASPPIFRVGDLPVKFYLSNLATRLLICGDANLDCTFEVWDLNANSQDICFPINDCANGGVFGGLQMDQGALGEVQDLTGQNETLVVCVEIDLAANPNPLGVGLPQVPQFFDCGFTPSFGTLATHTFTVQLCILSGTEDQLGFVAGHLVENEPGPEDDVVEFLAESFGPVVFGEENCDNLGELAEDAGFLERMRYAALNGVLRPAARFLGPQPLRAYDRTTWSSASDSPFGPVLRLDVLPNQGPGPIEEPGTEVKVSVCLAIPHLDPPVAPAADNQVEILFEVVTGGGSIGGSATATVSTALRNTTASDDCDVTDGSGQIAEAFVMWTLSNVAELNELTASIPGDFQEVVLDENGVPSVVEVETLSHTFTTRTAELLASCTTPDEFAAYDEFGHRGFYILPSLIGDGGIVGDDLALVQLRLSSNNSSNGRGLAGEYRVKLSARDGSYDPGDELDRAETTFTLSGDAPENETVSFEFDQLQNLGSTPVAFVAEILDAPRRNARLWFRVPEIEAISGYPQNGDPDCAGAIVTNGTTFTTPLNTNRRQGMDIKLLGVDNP